MVVSDVSSGSDDEDPTASVASKTYRAVRKAIQTSTIWRALNYSMNYDIHKVCGCVNIIIMAIAVFWGGGEVMLVAFVGDVVKCT